MRNPFKYPLKKEFFFLRFIVLSISTPISRWFWNLFANITSLFTHDSRMITRQIKLDSGATVKIIRPKMHDDQVLPVLLYYHGGGFVFKKFGPQESLLYRYIDSIGCAVVFVDYRLCPKHPYPAAFDDAYNTLMLIPNIADKYKLDASKILVMGDSAGGNLAAAVCLKARDDGGPKILGQLLIYPALDNRMSTPSAKEFTDTPIWNTKESKKMWEFYLAACRGPRIDQYAIPMTAHSFADLPTAYIETAEFDSLRDEAYQYSELLKSSGVDVEYVNRKGTCHGFELINCTVTETSIVWRISFMLRRLGRVFIEL